MVYDITNDFQNYLRKAPQYNPDQNYPIPFPYPIQPSQPPFNLSQIPQEYQPGDYSYLFTGEKPVDYTSRLKPFTDFYKPPEDTSAAMFAELLKSIEAPSSVEEVQRQIESEALKRNLEDIERGTKESVASSRLDFLDRGIGGPGQMSDIEANALAQLQTGGARTKAGSKTSVLLTQLGRQAE